jgi:DNA-directed RNA polymerase subunit RPC12/RpoP
MGAGVMAARQLDFLPKPPRRMRGQLMHVCDAGERGGKRIAEFKCSKCGHRSGWLIIKTVTEAKRGLPCPECNDNG